MATCLCKDIEGLIISMSTSLESVDVTSCILRILDAGTNRVSVALNWQQPFSTRNLALEPILSSKVLQISFSDHS
jgi:hypothetical protein